jgi:hypothetical protein
VFDTGASDLAHLSSRRILEQISRFDVNDCLANGLAVRVHLGYNLYLVKKELFGGESAVVCRVLAHCLSASLSLELLAETAPLACPHHLNYARNGAVKGFANTK